MSLNAYDGILLSSFGGPEGQEDVIPFLKNVTRGTGVPEERLEEVAHHYRAHNGVSPLNEQNRQLRAALEAELAARGIDLPVYWANRNWSPYFAEAVTEAHAHGHRRLLALVTSAYTSYSGVDQYREDFVRCLDETGLSDEVSIDRIREYFDHPGFVTPFVEGIRDAVALLTDEGAASRIHVLFSTHSIPDSAALASGPEFGPGGAYVAQHRAVAGYLSEEAAPGIPWSLVYQSRSGPPSQPWLEPDINEAIAELAEMEYTAVIIVPLGFVSDHMEVIWDLDTEAMATAREHGLAAVRVPTPGTHPAFVSGLVDLVIERATEAAWADRAAVSALGAWPDHDRVGARTIQPQTA
ncbi:ferrochelatase [Klugiella xanthotipulae]|uniref:Coproporphyrin III ferrochelatase n=1 Tax=Klugiella xanthotipulae TaxID=244735 RepID=A0A543I5Z8_9MICO|nr:ferrochelatase [Klugiella xanthotipulae]TQM65994.1 ferrochelatase [Klugiella xanthotipulae]